MGKLIDDTDCQNIHDFKSSAEKKEVTKNADVGKGFIDQLKNAME